MPTCSKDVSFSKKGWVSIFKQHVVAVTESSGRLSEAAGDPLQEARPWTAAAHPPPCLPSIPSTSRSPCTTPTKHNSPVLW
ncbi:hypothetical protein E2C01_098426 [Portunus trituberculatus]|uniref:Uncharacterized protein n=1 Tax=Portunus trituberculatus TaxID=210409 RepID=A0A5B7K165_PORTR|nr:hypothetical protein [Portunus trituberculatus]